jgi:hypothetical protein
VHTIPLTSSTENVPLAKAAETMSYVNYEAVGEGSEVSFPMRRTRFEGLRGYTGRKRVVVGAITIFAVAMVCVIAGVGVNRVMNGTDN